MENDFWLWFDAIRENNWKAAETGYNKTSGTAFRITGRFCGHSTYRQWIPLKMGL